MSRPRVDTLAAGIETGDANLPLLFHVQHPVALPEVMVAGGMPMKGTQLKRFVQYDAMPEELRRAVDRWLQTAASFR